MAVTTVGEWPRGQNRHSDVMHDRRLQRQPTLPTLPSLSTPPMTKRHPVLAVYGATSYTASQHLLPYLATHPDADKFHLIIAGRNADKLAALDASLPSGGPRREVVVLRLEDQGGVGALVERADVVINFAGNGCEG